MPCRKKILHEVEENDDYSGFEEETEESNSSSWDKEYIHDIERNSTNEIDTRSEKIRENILKIICKKMFIVSGVDNDKIIWFFQCFYDLNITPVVFIFIKSKMICWDRN